MSEQTIRERMTYVAPNDEAARRHREVGETLIAAAEKIAELVPASRGQSLALTKLEEARMWANQGIATNHALLPVGKPSE